MNQTTAIQKMSLNKVSNTNYWVTIVEILQNEAGDVYYVGKAANPANNGLYIADKAGNLYRAAGSISI